ncbi:hypothetical protein TcWFU_008731 [Taenia crassiceps]|uniref:Uncharacterized protein n=1 Tax=Taenia crassiceps TaxID=6207 RepID=A0ABR4Q0L6_9CEST
MIRLSSGALCPQLVNLSNQAVCSRFWCERQAPVHRGIGQHTSDIISTNAGKSWQSDLFELRGDDGPLLWQSTLKLYRIIVTYLLSRLVSWQLQSTENCLEEQMKTVYWGKATGGMARGRQDVD